MQKKNAQTRLKQGSSLFLAAMVVLLLGAATVAGGTYEKPPVLKAADLLPAKLLRGPHYRVEPRVPTDGFLAWFTIRSEFGTFRAAGPLMAAIRINEIQALAQLDQLSKSDVFVAGLKHSAREFSGAVKQMAAHPKETLEGVPEGIGRFFQRTYRGAKTGLQKLGDMQSKEPQAAAVIPGAGSKLPGGPASGAAKGEKPQVASATVRMAGKTTADAFGYDEQRRKLAKKLRIDPYTTNAVLEKKLDAIAWAAFAGGLGFTAVKSLAPGSTFISMTTQATDWVWDTPPGDLKVKNEKTLLTLGADQNSVDRFLRHPWYTLTLQSRLVRALKRMPKTARRKAVLPLALSVRSYDQARFVVESLEMLAAYNKTRAPLTALWVAGTVMGRTASGIVVPAPADAVSWNGKLDNFAHRPDFKTVRKRLLWVRGAVTPRAKKELTALGWTVQEDVGPKIKG